MNQKFAKSLITTLPKYIQYHFFSKNNANFCRIQQGSVREHFNGHSCTAKLICNGQLQLLQIKLVQVHIVCQLNQKAST